MEKLIITVFVFLSLCFQIFADDFSEGIEAYNKGNYLDAVQHLETFLNASGGAQDQRLLCKVYLGASQFILGKQSIATGWFLSILKDNHDYELNPVYFPPEIISFFNEIKGNVAGIVFRREKKHFYLNFLPFGAGQFQNHEFIKGGILLSVQVVALSVNLDTYIRRKSMEVAGKYPEERLSEAKRLQDIQLLSGGIFIAGYIYGVIDGALGYKKGGGEIGLSLLNHNPVLNLTYRF